MTQKKVHQKRLQSLDKGRVKSLGPVEKLTMRYAGWMEDMGSSAAVKTGTGSRVF